MLPVAHNHSKPTRWQAFPIVVERESSGSLAGKSVCMIQIWRQQPQVIESYQLSKQVKIFILEDLF